MSADNITADVPDTFILDILGLDEPEPVCTDPVARERVRLAAAEQVVHGGWGEGSSVSIAMDDRYLHVRATVAGRDHSVGISLGHAAGLDDDALRAEIRWAVQDALAGAEGELDDG